MAELDAITDLADAVGSLQNMVAVPGTFADTYPNVTDDMIVSVLLDGFAEAQLFGLLRRYSADDDGVIEPGLSRGQVALVVLFAAIRFLRPMMLSNATSVTYKAGSAEYSTSTSATTSNSILADLLAQRQAIIDELSEGGEGAAGAIFWMADQYLHRVCPVGFESGQVTW